MGNVLSESMTTLLRSHQRPDCDSEHADKAQEQGQKECENCHAQPREASRGRSQYRVLSTEYAPSRRLARFCETPLNSEQLLNRRAFLQDGVRPAGVVVRPAGEVGVRAAAPGVPAAGCGPPG